MADEQNTSDKTPQPIAEGELSEQDMSKISGGTTSLDATLTMTTNIANYKKETNKGIISNMK